MSKANESRHEALSILTHAALRHSSGEKREPYLAAFCALADADHPEREIYHTALQDIRSFQRSQQLLDSLLK